jgi:hypothetical protein
MTKTRVAFAASVALIGLLVTGCGPIGGDRLPALTQVESAEVLATCMA